MIDFFFSLLVPNIKVLMFKLILIPIFFILLTYLTNIIWLSISDAKKLSLPLHASFTMLKSLITSIIILNIYWGLLIKFNGLYLFNWKEFTFSLTNIYILITPFLLTLGCLIFLFIKTQTKIKNAIK